MLQRNAKRTRIRVVAVFLLLAAAYGAMTLFPRPRCVEETIDRASTLHPALATSGVKTIHLATRVFWSRIASSALQQTLQQCGETRCRFVDDIECADAVAFHMWDLYPTFWYTSVPHHVRQRQLWVLYGQESEARTLWYVSKSLEREINLTATYRLDSDMPLPYGHLEPLRAREKRRVQRNLANWTLQIANRSKTAFILSSHCYNTHSNRGEYVEELARFIDVDVYGKCGKPCPDGNCNMSLMAKSYKFYLSFENSKCEDYITEKFWKNALQHHLVPVVLGGQSKQDYLKVAPENSFIYADDFESPKHLATHLRALSSNLTAYLAYLNWTSKYKVESSPDKTMWECRVCKMLHSKPTIPANPTSRSVAVDVDRSRLRSRSRLANYWNSSAHCSPAIPDSSTVFSYIVWHFRYFLGL